MNVTKNKIKHLQTGKKIHDGRGLYFFKKGEKADGVFVTNAMDSVMKWDVASILKLPLPCLESNMRVIKNQKVLSFDILI